LDRLSSRLGVVRLIGHQEDDVMDTIGSSRPGASRLGHPPIAYRLSLGTAGTAGVPSGTTKVRR